jgi:hypothetical protein
MKASAFFHFNAKSLHTAGCRLTRLFFVFFIFLLFSPSLFSQTDTSLIKKHSPKKAAIMSACVPGLGQIYNKKYWKPPIIYVGAAAVIYVASFNSKYYRQYRNAYIARVDGDSTTIDNYLAYQTEDLLSMKNYYRRNLELTYIVGAAIYALNIIDATVDAHLFDFNVDDNLTMKISPALFCSHGIYSAGLSFKLNIGTNKYKQQR